MLDPRLLREQPDVVRRALQARGSNAPIDALLDQDARRLRVLRDVEELKARRNRLSQEVAAAKRQRQDATALVEESRALGSQISEGRSGAARPRRGPRADRPPVPERPARERAAGGRRGRERRGAPLGHAPRVRVPRAPPLGARRAPGDPRLRARRQARQGALHGAVGARRATRARPRPVHAGPPHEAARLPGGLGPASRERGDDARDGPAPEVRGGALQDRRAGGGAVALPHSRPPRCR